MAMDRDALAAYTVHFAYDSAAIQAQASNRASKPLPPRLSANSGAKLLIEGNCDERGTRNTTARSVSAVHWRPAKRWPSRVLIRRASGTISLWQDKPVESGHDESAWAKIAGMTSFLLHPKTGV